MHAGARLRQARELRAVTQQQLADKVKCSQGTLALVESGSMQARPELLDSAAAELKVPLAFFSGHPIQLPEGSLGLFRSKKTKVDRPNVVAARHRASLVFELTQGLSRGLKRPNVRFARVPELSASEAAAYCRNVFGLPPDAPIGNLTLLLERAGAVVITLSRLHGEIMGFSAWVGDRPVIVVNRNQGPFRMRFTLGHELGHLLLGHEAFQGPYKAHEVEANQFCQELTMPAEALLDDFGAGCGLDVLSALKGRWHMSMHALAMRAKTLGVINDSQYRYIHGQLRERGWLVVEPGDLLAKSEGPRVLRQMAELQGFGKPPNAIMLALEYGLPEDVVSDALQCNAQESRLSRIFDNDKELA